MNFIVSILFSGFAVSVLVLIPWVGVWALDLRVLFGIIVPYAAMATFFVGIVVRVIDWGRSPVPASGRFSARLWYTRRVPRAAPYCP